MLVYAQSVHLEILSVQAPSFQVQEISLPFFIVNCPISGSFHISHKKGGHCCYYYSQCTLAFESWNNTTALHIPNPVYVILAELLLVMLCHRLGHPGTLASDDVFRITVSFLWCSWRQEVVKYLFFAYATSAVGNFTVFVENSTSPNRAFLELSGAIVPVSTECNCLQGWPHPTFCACPLAVRIYEGSQAETRVSTSRSCLSLRPTQDSIMLLHH